MLGGKTKCQKLLPEPYQTIQRWWPRLDDKGHDFFFMLFSCLFIQIVSNSLEQNVQPQNQVGLVQSKSS